MMPRTNNPSLSVAALVLLAAAATPAAATFDSFFDVFIDAGECRWRAINQEDPVVFSDGAGFQTEMLSMSLSRSPGTAETITDIGGNQFRIESFFDISYQVDLPDPGPTPDVFFDVFFDVILDASDDGNPDTARSEVEILSMDLSGSTGGPNNLTIPRLSPAADHRGHVTILKSPTNPNDFQIDSFFDVFFELSLDGGNSWLSSSEPVRLFESETFSIPEPSAVGLLGLASVALVARRREARDR